jgi:HEAT repeat protein
MTHQAVATILLALVTSVMGAGEEEKSLEARWHEAYVLEVVEGKIPEAARTYMDLIREPDIPKHLLRESKFRLAVCCALLGRTDEARSVLAGLATDESAPAEFRARVAEYHEKLANAGVGSALDKRLEALVYEMGRAPATGTGAPQYRDFQIIGKPAVPTLAKLLEHRDATLRTHAYRILCRMDEPIVVTMLPETGTAAWTDLRGYLGRNPGMMERVEPRLLEFLVSIPPEKVGYYVRDSGLWRLPTWGMPFIESLAAREGYEGLVLQMLRSQTWTEYARETLAGWMRSGRDSLATTAAGLWLERIHAGGDDGDVAPLLDADLFPHLVRGTKGLTTTPYMTAALTRYARAMPSELVISVLDDLAKASEEGKLTSSWRHVLRGLEPFGERVKADALVRSVRKAVAKGYAPSGSTVHFLFHRLPLEDGRRLVGDVLKTANGSLPTGLIGYATERDVELFLAILECDPGPEPASFAGTILGWATRKGQALDEYRHALARALPRLWRLTLADEPRSSNCLDAVAALSRGMPDEAVRGILAELAAVLPDVHVAYRKQGLWNLILSKQDDVTGQELIRFNREIRARALGEVARASGMLEDVIEAAISPMTAGHDRTWSLGSDGYGPILDFLEENQEMALARFGPQASMLFARHADRFPLPTWVPKTSPEFSFRVAPKQADAAAEALTSDPAKVNVAVLRFLKCNASLDVQTRVFDRLLSTGDASVASLVQSQLGRTGLPASAAALEKALKTLMGTEGTPLRTLSELGRRVVLRDPSPVLFPLARRLVGSEDRARVLEGIEMAQSLGSKDLVPALIGKLDSLDAGVREAARKAIDAIFEIDRIKEEARKRLGEK